MAWEQDYNTNPDLVITSQPFSAGNSALQTCTNTAQTDVASHPATNSKATAGDDK